MSPFESGTAMLSSGSYLVLSGNQLLLGSGLFLFSLLLSLLLRLQLIRTMGIAAVRMVVQLLLVGLVLDWIFSRQDPGIILLMAILMASVAAASAALTPSPSERSDMSCSISDAGKSPAARRAARS